MSLANLIDQITIGSISIATVDSDPSINGYTSSLGSFAQYTNGSNVVFFYEKTGAADTAWTIVDLGIISLTTQVSGILPTSNGGTGLDTHLATNGQVLIGNGSGLTLNTLTAGSNVSIVNTAGTITIASTLDGTLHTDTVNTTDATVTTLSTVATVTDTTMLLECKILGRRTGGTAGTVDDSLTFIRTLTLKNIAGTVSIKQTQSDYTYQDDGAWKVTFLVSGTNVLVQVQGKANENISWVNSDMFTRSL